MSGISNQPRILKGAFVEWGLSMPPAIVVFQFNPDLITRERITTFSVPSSGQAQGRGEAPLREFHQNYSSLTDLRDLQEVKVGSETITFDIHMDATDKMNEGDTIAGQFGISPALSTLELMMYPKSESMLGGVLSSLLGSTVGHTFTGSEKPPMVLFIWGRKKVLPVNITNMRIKEEEFSPDLNPTRATITMSLMVIEGPNLPYKYSQSMKEAMSLLNLANIPEVASVVIPL